MICHLGYLSAGSPVVLPTTHTRLGETLYLHGSTGSGPMLAAQATPAGLPVCVTVTLIDGLVLARSALHHSLNYRSVVVTGSARLVRDRREKLQALEALFDHVASGRTADSRTPNRRELAATAVLALDLIDVCAQVRAGGPVDDPRRRCAAVLGRRRTLKLAATTPVPAGDLDTAISLPPYLTPYRRP